MSLVGTDSCLGIRVRAEEFNVNKGMVRQEYSFKTPNFCVANEYFGQNHWKKNVSKNDETNFNNKFEHGSMCVRKSC